MTDSATVPQPPRTVRVALIAIGAQIVFTLISAALFWGYTAQRNQQLVNSNKKLKTPKNPYTPADIAHDLHSVRVGVTIQSIIVCALFALAAVNIYRGRGIARWLYIAAAVIFSVGGIVALGQSGPGASNLASFAVAVSAIAAIVLLIMPESSRYFLAIKALRMPPGARNAGAAATRPAGLRGLFAPPPPRLPRNPAANGKASDGSAVADERPPGSQPGRTPRPDRRKPATTRPADASGSAAVPPTAGAQETTAETAAGSTEAATDTPADTARGAAPGTSPSTPSEPAIRRKPKVRASAATDGTFPGSNGSSDVAGADDAPDASTTRSRGKSRRV